MGIAGLLAALSNSPILRRLGSAFASDAADASGPLTDAERNTLTALTLLLIPSSFASKVTAAGGEGDAAKAAAVIAGILDEQATNDDFHAAAAFLDSKSMARHQLPFAGLDMERRRNLFGDLVTPYTTRTLFSNPYYHLTDDGRKIRDLWDAVAKPILVRFYFSRVGWQLVGYPRRPGDCWNLIDYQFPAA